MAQWVGIGRTDKEKIIAFCNIIIRELEGIDMNKVTLRVREKEQILNDAPADLKEVNGAMVTVGGDEYMGDRYELRFEVRK